ncbi:centrosomal protein of 104 kDa isoform X3 [Salmo salar]|uniref:Centrosomal protein of 104 kDa isoform X3 n=1 Tax=Salmo salar TaxID=8030 RepID=A0A1S3MD54_SALSA|nr:centrosomal protein of 104 kDa isoform X3 [Salmo salar]|eukprot:XP_014001138.1 PREDICTED: centrosomal protein of 104 kDa isoform X3 [Salmo salar]
MPRKIGFTLVSSSGHEDNFSAKELMVHAPTVNGWRSARFCPYPQQITLQLPERSRVRKLQLLAHQYLISGKIEFHIGDRLLEADSPGLSGHLRRLGYVSLSDNEKTGFKARELKSVHVDAIGTYLRITFHRNHVNRYNLYNQVALVAINVLGDSVDGTAVDTIPSREQLIEHYLNSQHETALDGTYMGKCESISPLDDLAFDMYQDPEVAHIIHLLDDKKQEMVRQERYEFAKTLKQAIADLQKVGERLGRYDVEKCCAIEKEDYDTAKKKKEQMEEYRMTVYHQLEVHNLLDMGMIREMTESPSEDSPDVPSPRRHQVGHKMRVVTETRRRNQEPVITETVGPFPPKPVSPPQTLLRSLSLTPRSYPAVPRIDVTTLPYDERPLPALQRKGEMPQSHPEESSLPPSPLATIIPCSPGVTGEPEPLTESAQREASFPIEVYGDGLVAGAYSKTWSYREDALLAVYKKLTEVSAGTPKEKLRNMMRAAVFLVKKALKDKVSSVFQASLKLLRLLLTQLIPGQALGRAEVVHCVEQTWPNLLSRTGDSATRLRAMATAFIQFCTGALQHSASEVRETVVLIILAMYRLHKTAILSYLPANYAATRKNVLYKNIFDGFARIDGRPVESQTSKKGGTQQEGEKEEIRSLQEQLAALNEISKGNFKVENEKGNTKGQKKEAVKVVKTGVKTAPQSNPEDAGDNQSSVVNNLDNLCIFCGEKDESFTEDGLDLHYWKHCPMLHCCDKCRQVVEIASLTEHLLGECENRARFSQCPRCSEAVPTDEVTHHTQSPACNPPGSVKGSNHCPLCHNNFVSGEETWKAHLMGREGCKQNSRRTAVSLRAQLAQGKPGSVAKLKQVWSVGSRGRAMGKGSRIPALAPRASRTHTSRLTPVKR